ncbi:proton-coupled zinc antiporter SLC30A1 isoform X2 [Diachasmimorpha longicaudata]|uniref:proton-coupled zinc antiporter SLC30A1 isoform X2 n=1 Tax=Diachasmimorpha longicaudata TaxID=58733 RepID=UPI0030B8FB50
MAVKEWFRRLQPVQLYLVLFFTTAFFIVEIIASHVTHSLTLLLNAYHMLCNIVALLGCIVSLKYGSQEQCRTEEKAGFRGSSTLAVCEDRGSSKSLPTDPKQVSPDNRMKNTFGWARIDILTMMVCGVFLASFCFTLLLEAVLTLGHIGHLDQMHLPVIVMGIGASGIILNLFCYLIIGGYTFNQSLYLHVTKDGSIVLQRDVADGEQKLAPTRRSPIAMPKSRRLMEITRDVFPCVLVVVASVLVHFTYEESTTTPGKPSEHDISKYFDPAIAIISAIFLFTLSYPYLRDSCLILLQTIPNHINIDSLQKELLAAFPGIVNVHDFHVWHLAGTKVVSTVHITFLNPKVYATITDQVTAFFVEMGITQVTIQPEFHKSNVDKTDCLIRCRGRLCIQSQCCKGEDVLEEIISSNSERELQTDNKSYLKKEIIPVSSEVDLRRFTLNKSDDEKSFEEINVQVDVDVSPEYSNSTDEEIIAEVIPGDPETF